MPSSGDPVQLSPAAELFAQFIERREAGEPGEFEALCASHPELAPKLRSMFSSWRLLSDAFDAELESGREREEAVSSARADVAQLRREAPDSERLSPRGEVAHGGRGRILGVWDRDLRRELAMKVLIDARSADDLAHEDPRALARFLEEAQVTGQLEHPGIVPVHELGVDADGQVFFTMPLIRGESFQRVVERVHAGEWTRARALGVLLRVCEAVAYAHSRGVVHRDLKPSNVMVGPFGETYVIDWGLARVGEEVTEGEGVRSARADYATGSPLLTGRGDVVGTPAYMAPEQARGDLAAIGPAADVYAIGGMLYELLTGRPPFGEPTSTPEQTLSEVLTRPPAPLGQLSPDVPAELVAICERAMEREAGRRYPSVIDLADDLRAFLELRVVRAYRTGPLAELGKWVRRNRAFAAASAAAGLAIVVGFAASLWLFLLADARGDDVLRLSASRDLERLRLEADDLWPAHPARVDDMVDWVARAEALTADLPAHRSKRADLRRSAGVDPEEPVYGDDAGRTAWWDEQLTRLIDELEDLERGLLGPESAGAAGWSVPRRIEQARSLDERTVIAADARERWAVAAEEAAARYDGLRLVPQLGLLPIGADPDSGLLEFWHVASGEEPRRDAGGRLRLLDETGIVLVLLPGGSFRMGAQSEDPEAFGYDPAAVPVEAPVDTVELAPFLIAKYETTQAQWLRLYESNPSSFNPGESSGGVPVTIRHPVETVDWFGSDRFAFRMGLSLPTEAQWEYACRAGSTAKYSEGDSVASIEGLANLADEGSAWNWSEDFHCIADYDDGFPGTAPVGSLAANAFGLHDLHGNVWEWCADAPALYGKYPAAPGDGARRSTAGRTTGLYRGGSYYTVAHSARAAYRGFAVLDVRADDSGFRVALNLRGAEETP